MNMDMYRGSRPQGTEHIAGLPQIPHLASEGRDRLDPLYGDRPVLADPRQLLRFALSDQRVISTDRQERRAIAWLPNARAYRVIDTDTGAVLSVAREAMGVKRGQVEGKSVTACLRMEIDRIMRHTSQLPRIDPNGPTRREIYAMSSRISDAVGVPLVFKQIPEHFSGGTDPLHHIDFQFLRMRALRERAKMVLSPAKRDVIDFCRVFASYFHPKRDGTTTQWLLMEEVVGGRMSAEALIPSKHPDLAAVIGHPGNRLIEWSDVERFLVRIGLPPQDLGGRNALQSIKPDGRIKYTIIDQ